MGKEQKTHIKEVSMAKSTVFKVWCEYDIGQDEFIFENKDEATAWGKAQVEKHVYEETYQELVENGLIGLHYVTLVWA